MAAVTPTSGPGESPTWRFTVGDPDQPIAMAELSLGRDGCGVLWWLEVEPNRRGRGVGRRVLLQALRFLALRGGRTVAAFVDHAAGHERDRRPALRLFASVGFQEVDRLRCYESLRKTAR